MVRHFTINTAKDLLYMSTALIIILLVLALFVVVVAAVFVGGWITDRALVAIDALDGEIGENNGPRIREEFTLPDCKDELEQFKQELLAERDRAIQDHVVEDLKDGVLGNLPRDRNL
jgi:hypothetical protein